MGFRNPHHSLVRRADFVLFKLRVPLDSADEDGGGEGWDCDAALLRVEATVARGRVGGVPVRQVTTQTDFTYSITPDPISIIGYRSRPFTGRVDEVGVELKVTSR